MKIRFVVFSIMVLMGATFLANAQEASAPIVTQAADKVQSIVSAVSGAPVPESAPNQNSPKYMQLDSMMFTKKELNYVEQALYAHMNSVPIEVLLPEIFPPQREQAVVSKSGPKDNFTPSAEMVAEVKPAVTMSDLPNFFLRSILYSGPDNWVVWVNGQKITPEKGAEDFSVEDVTESSIRLRWKFSEFADLLPQMVETCSEIGDNKMLCAQGESDVIIDRQAREAVFTLHPNQTFVGRSSSVEEGNGKPDKNAGDIANVVPVPSSVDASAEKDQPMAPRKLPALPDISIDKIKGLKDILTH